MQNNSEIPARIPEYFKGYNPEALKGYSYEYLLQLEEQDKINLAKGGRPISGFIIAMKLHFSVDKNGVTQMSMGGDIHD